MTAANPWIHPLPARALVLAALLLAAPAGAQEPLPAHGLELPASFTGTLPCADCEGIAHHLDLWPDQVFHLRREWLGKGRVHGDIGRWHADPSREALVLKGGTEMPIQFEIEAPDRIRLLDMEGQPIVSDLPYELASDGTLDPAEIPGTFRGMMIYFADAARLTECVSGRSLPIAMEGDFVAMQRSYLEKRPEPTGEQMVGELMVSFEGRIAQRPRMEGGGTEAAFVVERFINVWPGETCERNMTDAALENTYWKILRLGGMELGPVEEGRREPHLVLRAEESRYAATVGCNQMLGGYEAGDSTIEFKMGISTMMACPPPLDEHERALAQALADARGWRIDGQALTLTDADGAEVGLFQAVYLP